MRPDVKHLRFTVSTLVVVRLWGIVTQVVALRRLCRANSMQEGRGAVHGCTAITDEEAKEAREETGELRGKGLGEWLEPKWLRMLL